MPARFDTASDGPLSQDARDAAHEARRAQREQKKGELLAKYDANADGELDKSERETLRASEDKPDRDPLLQMLRPRRGPGAHQERGERGQRGDRPRFQRRQG